MSQYEPTSPSGRALLLLNNERMEWANLLRTIPTDALWYGGERTIATTSGEKHHG
jgi:hypothetical protein